MLYPLTGYGWHVTKITALTLCSTDQQNSALRVTLLFIPNTTQSMRIKRSKTKEGEKRNATQQGENKKNTLEIKYNYNREHNTRGQHKDMAMHHYLQGLHHWLCWSRPYRARHFFILFPTTSICGQLSHCIANKSQHALTVNIQTCILRSTCNQNLHSLTITNDMQIKYFPLTVYEYKK